MPTIYPELVQPLTEISEILQTRPGSISIDGIKRLSGIYGFETFTDLVDPDTHNPIVQSPSSPNARRTDLQETAIQRISIAGKIILIDIDFEKESVINVSLSLAINVPPTKGVSLNFVESTLSPNVEAILLSNLNQESSLAAFNENLRFLTALDKFSQPDFDLFNYFHRLSRSIYDCYNYQLGSESSRGKDIEEGLHGIGKVMFNVNNQIGVYLKYWQSRRFLNQRLRVGEEFLVKFAVKEVSPESDAALKDPSSEWFANGEWAKDIPQSTGINCALALELFPPVWVPVTLLEGCGLYEYECVTAGEGFLDFFYKNLNDGTTSGFLLKGSELNVNVLAGSRFVKLEKVTICDVGAQLNVLLDGLRNWCLVNQLIRGVERFIDAEPRQAINVEDITLDDFIKDAEHASRKRHNLSIEPQGLTQLALWFEGNALRIDGGFISGDNGRLVTGLTKTEDLVSVSEWLAMV